MDHPWGLYIRINAYEARVRTAYGPRTSKIINPSRYLVLTGVLEACPIVLVL
jgi:hypothetical protein